MLDPISQKELELLTIKVSQLKTTHSWRQIVKKHLSEEGRELKSILNKYVNYRYGLGGEAYSSCSFNVWIFDGVEDIPIYQTVLRNVKDLFFLVKNVRKQLRSLRIFEFELKGGIDGAQFTPHKN